MALWWTLNSVLLAVWMEKRAPWSKECVQPLKAFSVGEVVPLEPPEKRQPCLLTSWFHHASWTSQATHVDFYNYTVIKLFYLKLLNLWSHFLFVFTADVRHYYIYRGEGKTLPPPILCLQLLLWLKYVNRTKAIYWHTQFTSRRRNPS